MDVAQRFASARRLQARFLQAKGIARGDTFQNEKVRIHRYNDSIHVTDLTNAGKRGKKCPFFTVDPTYNYKGDRQAWFDRISDAFLDYVTGANPLQGMKNFIKDLQHDFPNEINLTEQDLKSISVEPFGVKYQFTIPSEDGKSSIEIESSPTDFRILDRHWFGNEKGRAGGFFQDTSYWPVKRADAILFYGWMKDNHSKVPTFKTLEDVLTVLNKAGVRYDSH